MASQSVCTFGVLVALLTVLSAATALPWYKCSHDIKGLNRSTPIHMERIYLEPFQYYKLITVPRLCDYTYGVEAYACAVDIAPAVKVNTFTEVFVVRMGEAGSRISVDITAYCVLGGTSVSNTVAQ